MAIAIGVIAAFIAFNRRNGQTRLRTLQQKLEKKQPPKIKLYQYPVKKIFAVVFILALAIGLEWFSMEYEKDMRGELAQRGYSPSIDPLVQPNIELYSSDSKPTAITHESLAISTQNIEISIEIDDQIKLNETLSTLRTTLIYMHVLFVVALMGLLLDLDWRVISVSKGEKTIKLATYRMLGLMVQREQYSVKQGDRMVIWQLGESRFTNTNYYYSVRIINQKKSWSVIKRACMFDARTTIIQLAYQLEIPYSTKVSKSNDSQCNSYQEQE